MSEFIKQNEIIAIAKDRTIDEATRSDAISYLAEFPDVTTLNVLVELAQSQDETLYIYEKIGESLGWVITMLGENYLNVLIGLPERIKFEATAIIKQEKPSWINLQK